MGQFGGKLRLAPEACAALGAVSDVGWQDFERHEPVQLLIPRKVHRPHPAATEQPYERILPRDSLL